MSPAAPETGVVLYAEDDENDAFLLRHCWKRAAIPQRLVIVPDGQRALDYLTGAGSYADRAAHPLPQLLLLDLNLPRLTGMEVLRWARAQPALAGLPAAILSSSNQKKDMDTARALGADDYFVKPGNVVQLAGLVQTFRARWLEPRGAD